MLEAVVEPRQRVAVLVGVLRHREVVGRAGLEDHLRGGDLDRVENAPRTTARLQQRDERVDYRPLALACEGVDQHRLFRRRQRRLLPQQLGVATVQQVLDHVAAHLVRRIPARADGDIRHARVDDVLRRVPAERLAQLDRGARAERLVACRVRAVVQHSILHVDEPREREVSQHAPAVRHVLHQPQEHSIGRQHVAALHERQPVVQPLADLALERQRLLIGPVRLGHRRRLVDLDLVEARVVAGRFAEQLIPRIESARDVPDRLRQREHRELGPHQVHERQRHALAEQAVIVVHELHDAVVEALVIGHMRVRRVDPHRLRHDLRDGALVLDEAVQRRARADLVPSEDPLLEPGVVGGDRHGREYTSCPAQRVSRGSRPSRIASPTKFRPTTVTNRATPGPKTIHGACCK